MVWKVEVHIETPQIALLVTANLANLVLWENLASGSVFDMGKRHEPLGQQ
ncbi:hypothetical protein GCM10007937_24760 [Mesorhizobium albiziae]|nr:hypothetical protein GCM10007937_24760 [Mesorhizobium albiziae]